jgi:hypothetical protein
MRRIVMLLVVSLGLGVGAAAYSGTWSRAAEHRGSCSHHSGVCGCSKGRATCCDGNIASDIPLSQIIRGVLPLLALMIAAVVLMSVCPRLVTALPDALMGPTG